jgi:ketosteroid isomerase-like protein
VPFILDPVPNPNVQRAFDMLVAYQQGDDEKLREVIHPEGEVHGAPGIVNAGTYHGFEGFQQWVSQWEEAWDEISYELGELVEVDEAVLVAPVHIVGRGAGSGVEIDRTFGWLYQWEDGLLVRFHVYPSTEDAVAAAQGLVRERA